MRAARRRFLTRGAASLAALCICPEGLPQTKPTVTGTALGRDNQGIPGVLVTVTRGGTKIGESTAGPGGIYTVEYEAGAPIQTVRYEMTNYLVGMVAGLCGIKSHVINKTMYLRTQNLTVLEGLEALSALERVFYIDTTNKISIADLQERYGPMIEGMRKTIQAPPPSVMERIKAVLKLYQLL